MKLQHVKLILIFMSLISSIATKEGNVLVNDALNTLYLRLYGVGHNNG